MQNPPKTVFLSLSFISLLSITILLPVKHFNALFRSGFMEKVNTEYTDRFSYDRLLRVDEVSMSKEETVRLLGEPFWRLAPDQKGQGFYFECLFYSRQRLTIIALMPDRAWISVGVCFDESGKYTGKVQTRWWN